MRRYCRVILCIDVTLRLSIYDSEVVLRHITMAGEKALISLMPLLYNTTDNIRSTSNGNNTTPFIYGSGIFRHFFFSCCHAIRCFHAAILYADAAARSGAATPPS